MTQFIKMPDGEYIPFDMWHRYITHTLFSKDFLSFEEARKFIRKLELKSETEWRKYCKSGKKPDNIPAVPERIYKGKWNGWGDFLGTGNVYRKDFLSFAKSRIFVRKLKLKSAKEWRKYCKSGKKPDNIPFVPDITYKDKGWISWGDFLGTGTIRKKDFISFEEAREFARSLNLKSVKEWYKYCKSGNKPNNIPSVLDKAYKDKWKGWGDFLGTGNISSRNRNFLSFEDAREFVRNLELKSKKEWRKYCKSGNKSNNIPYGPDRIYKGKWIDWYDWLGKKRKTA